MTTMRVPSGVPTGGQFAASVHDVANGVALSGPVQALHERLTHALHADSHRRRVGRFENVTENSLTFVEETFGDTETRYDVRFDGGAITVRDEYTDATYESYSFRFDGQRVEPSDADILKAIGHCREARRDIVAANDIFAGLETGVVSRDLDAGIATVDLGDGRLPVVLGPYSSLDDGFDEPHLRVNVGGTPYRLTLSGGGSLPDVAREDLADVDEDEAATVLGRVGEAVGGSAHRLIESLHITRSKRSSSAKSVTPGAVLATSDPTRDQSYCDVGQHQACSGYTEDEMDPESCMCHCHTPKENRR